MSMKRVATLRARTEKYTDRQTGQEKQGYTTMGFILQKDDGTRMFKIDSIPVGFDGWVFEGELQSKAATDQMQPAQSGQQAPAKQEAFDDDIPF